MKKLLLFLLVLASPAAAQDTRATVTQMQSRFERIRFTPPVPRQVKLSNGVQVFLL